MKGLGELLALASDRIDAQLASQLPHACLELPLGTFHRKERYALEWYARLWDLSWDLSLGSRRATR